MANETIAQQTALAAAASDDLIPIWDTSASAYKYITVANLHGGTIVTTDDTQVLTNKSFGDAVGIGTASPTRLLDLESSAPVIGLTDTDTGAECLVNANTASGSIAIHADQGDSVADSKVQLVSDTETILTATIISAAARVGINDTSPSYTLDVDGDINATGEVRNSGTPLTSDLRLKTNVETLPDALSKVMAMRGVQFDWDETKQQTPKAKGRQTGFVAQEVEEILPDLVSEWEVSTGETFEVEDERGNVEVRNVKETIKCIDYSRMVPVLLEAIKELSAEVDALKAR